VNAVERWGRALEAWGIPQEILDAAPESPWGLPPELFRRRADVATRLAPSVSARRALEALPEGGSVLDVGVGGGAASLPLAPHASAITGVDDSQEMLRAFAEAAEAAGVRAIAVPGRWPDAGDRVEPADVVVCNHVLYNVREIEPFVRALDGHARSRVVIEITATHPLAWMSDLWAGFHGLERPDRPTADDAEEALRELGLPVRREDDRRRPRATGFERREDAVSLVRRRLCLPAARDEDVAAALGERLAQSDGLWSAGPKEQTVVTLWWDARTA